MSVADLQELEEIKNLVAKGQTTGVLTYKEVVEAVGEIELEDGDLEDLHSFIESSEIELLEDADPRATPPPTAEPAPKGRKAKAKTTIDYRPDMTTDSLQLFLKDIGKVRLLTAQEEVDLAKRTERADLHPNPQT